MALTEAQKSKIAQYVPIFNNYLSAERQADDLNARRERIELYEELLSSSGIEAMNELDFGRVIASLWSFAMWGNKGYLVDKLLRDNPIDEMKKNLHHLLWGNEDLAVRYDTFKENTYGFGPASITELLSFTHPQDCGLWNTKARKALLKLGFEDTLPFIKNYQLDGQQYALFIQLLKEICAELVQQNIPELDLLGVNYFLYEVRNNTIEFEEAVVEREREIGEEQVITDFDHDEAIENLLTIGQWLGFEVEKEKTIARGARVDAIWQASVANLGVVTYVFEVQRRGSRDGLILNLQRAQNNPTVQRLIIVALADELEGIRSEILNLPENFRRMVGYMEVTELMRATDLVSELSGIISKLELVKSEFGG